MTLVAELKLLIRKKMQGKENTLRHKVGILIAPEAFRSIAQFAQKITVESDHYFP